MPKENFQYHDAVLHKYATAQILQDQNSGMNNHNK